MAPTTWATLSSITAALSFLVIGSGVDVIGYESSLLGLALTALGCLGLLVALAFLGSGSRARAARGKAVGDLASLVLESKSLTIWGARGDDEEASMDEAADWVKDAIQYVLHALGHSYDQRLRTKAELPLTGDITGDHVRAPIPLSTYPNTHSIVRDRVSQVRYKLESFMEELRP